MSEKMCEICLCEPKNSGEGRDLAMSIKWQPIPFWYIDVIELSCLFPEGSVKSWQLVFRGHRGNIKNATIPSFQWKTCNRSLFLYWHVSKSFFFSSLSSITLSLCMRLSSLHLLLYHPPTHTHTAITHRATHTQTQIHNAITQRNAHTQMHYKSLSVFSFQKVVCKAKEALKRQKLVEKNNREGQMTKNRPVFQWQKYMASNLYLHEHSHSTFTHTQRLDKIM